MKKETNINNSDCNEDNKGNQPENNVNLKEYFDLQKQIEKNINLAKSKISNLNFNLFHELQNCVPEKYKARDQETNIRRIEDDQKTDLIIFFLKNCNKKINPEDFDSVLKLVDDEGCKTLIIKTFLENHNDQLDIDGFINILESSSISVEKYKKEIIEFFLKNNKTIDKDSLKNSIYEKTGFYYQKQEKKTAFSHFNFHRNLSWSDIITEKEGDKSFVKNINSESKNYNLSQQKEISKELLLEKLAKAINIKKEFVENALIYFFEENPNDVIFMDEEKLQKIKIQLSDKYLRFASKIEEIAFESLFNNSKSFEK